MACASWSTVGNLLAVERARETSGLVNSAHVRAYPHVLAGELWENAASRAMLLKMALS